MSAHRRPRKVFAWLAALAMLLASLAPALADVGAGADRAAWGEICSAQGAKAVERAPDKGGAHLLEHCPSCALHLPAWDLPPAPAAGVAALDRAEFFAAAPRVEPRAFSACVAAQPRAPPLAS